MSEQSGDTRQDTGLTGFWTGHYWYFGQAEPTPFNAWFSDVAGVLSGTTLEPNTFAASVTPELSAVVDGGREGHAVDFTKRYDAGQETHAEPIRYSGAVNAAFDILEGGWRFDRPTWPSGGFRLERLKRTAEKAERVMEVVVVLGSQPKRDVG